LTLTLNDLPEVSFAEKDINKIISDMISEYEKAHFESTGKIKKLYPGDPIRIWIYTQALRELQLRVLIDDSAKQNLLKYSRGDSLDNLGAFSRTQRFEEEASFVRMKFTLSGARPTPETISQGTRVSPGGELYFAVLEDAVIPAGQMEIEFLTICLQVGTVGNGFTAGQINILVDPIPFIASVENIEESQGGTDREDDDKLRDRIHLAPEGFSVAGPEGAYEYFTRQYSPLIQDVKITSPSDGVVDIRVLLIGGELPGATFISGLSDHLNARDKRPLTDKLQAGAPTTVAYNLDVTYYIRLSEESNENNLKEAIETAIDEYTIWQKGAIGRDINPSELIARCLNAGAKRIEITLPVFTPIDNSNQVAALGTKAVVYGGLE
jgi:phage-related baseplate assembly protein